MLLNVSNRFANIVSLRFDLELYFLLVFCSINNYDFVSN